MMNEKKLADVRLPKGYFIEDGAIWLTGRDDKPAKRLLSTLVIVEVKRDIFSQEESYLLNYLNGDTWIETRINASILTMNNIDSLVKLGVDVIPANRALVVAYLIAQRHLAPIVKQYEQVGWHELDDGQLHFLSSTVTLQPEGQDNWNHDDTKLDLTPVGTSAHYLSELAILIKGNFNLQMAVAIGLSGSLMWPLKQWIDKDLTTLVVNFVGASTTGKTTAASLAISVAGDPSVTSNGPASTWKQTPNALVTSLANNKGIPRLLDELNTYPYKDVTSMIYDLSNGQEKQRLNKDGVPRGVASWCTTIISTAEVSIFTKTASANDGLRVRVLELTVPWTASSEEAGRVKMFASNNYGALLPVFIEHLLTDGVDAFKEKLIEAYDHCYNSILPLLPETKFKERIAARCAVITTTGMMASEAFNWGLELDAMNDWLIHGLSDFSEDISERAANDFIQWLIANQSSLLTKNRFYTPHVIIGRIESETNHIHCDIIKNILVNQLKEMGYEDPKVVIDLWLKSGFVKPSSDRPTVRTVIGGVRETSYRLIISKEYYSDFKNVFYVSDPDESEEQLDDSKVATINEIPKNPLIEALEKAASEPTNLCVDTDLDDLTN